MDETTPKIKAFIVEEFMPDVPVEDLDDDFDLLTGGVVDSLGNTDRLVLNGTIFADSTPPGPRFGRGGGEFQSTMYGNGGQNWFFTLYPTEIVDLKAEQRR